MTEGERIMEEITGEQLIGELADNEREMQNEVTEG